MKYSDYIKNIAWDVDILSREKITFYMYILTFIKPIYDIFFFLHRKDYPDYFEVITNPIDMKTINERIKSEDYKNVDQFISDARLMFNNCRQYNEEGSAIVKDANTLEKKVIYLNLWYYSLCVLFCSTVT